MSKNLISIGPSSRKRSVFHIELQSIAVMLHVANTYENSHQRAAIDGSGKPGLCTAILAIAEECDYYKQEAKKDRKMFNNV